MSETQCLPTSSSQSYWRDSQQHSMCSREGRPELSRSLGGRVPEKASLGEGQEGMAISQLIGMWMGLGGQCTF